MHAVGNNGDGAEEYNIGISRQHRSSADVPNSPIRQADQRRGIGSGFSFEMSTPHTSKTAATCWCGGSTMSH